MKITIHCDFCGTEITRYPSQLKKHNFCSRECLASFGSRSANPEGYQRLKDYSNMRRNMRAINMRLNPVRMTLTTRGKLRAAHLANGKGYAKFFGHPEHRLTAEICLGRKLLPGEVVHHIDGDKRNNRPDNLAVFSSQSRHAAWHQRVKQGGDA